VLVDAHLDFVRYAMHDFVRLFVRERPPTDADAAVRRALVGSQLYGGLWVFMIERMVDWVGEVVAGWARSFGVHPQTAYRWFREGRMPVPARL
jgi:hypothetical protein